MPEWDFLTFPVSCNEMDILVDVWAQECKGWDVLAGNRPYFLYLHASALFCLTLDHKLQNNWAHIDQIVLLYLLPISGVLFIPSHTLEWVRMGGMPHTYTLFSASDQHICMPRPWIALRLLFIIIFFADCLLSSEWHILSLKGNQESNIFYVVSKKQSLGPS